MIIHVITSLNVGGAEQALKRLLLSRSEGSANQVVISLTGLGSIGQELRQQGIEVYALGATNSLTLLFTFHRLIKLLRTFKPSIVQTWLYHADLVGGLAARIAGVKHVIWGVRTTELKQGAYITSIIRKLLAWLSYLVPSKIVCVAEASKEKHIKIGYCAKKMVVIGNGFDLSQLQAPSGQRQFLRELFNFSDNNIVIGSVGRLSQDKGQDIFIKAAGLLIKMYPDVRFLMVGRQLQSENADLMAWLNAEGVTDQFVLLGERNDIPDCLSVMDIFCLPSRTEGFPNVLGEAMALGLPCVATDVGDSGILLGGTGILVQKNNPQALADGLVELLKYSKQQRKSLGLKAQHRVAVEYTLERSCKKYEALYSELLNGDS